MASAYAVASFWFFLAILAAVLAKHLGISSALVEIWVGAVAASIVTPWLGPDAMGARQEWLRFLAAKVASKIFGLYPVICAFRRNTSKRWYYTLLVSTGLTFGTISALYGLSHGIVQQEQYSFLVAVVIGSAVIPTLIAGIALLPRYLVPKPWPAGVPDSPMLEEADGLTEE